MKRPLPLGKSAKALTILIGAQATAQANGMTIDMARGLQGNFVVPPECEVFNNQFFWTTSTERPVVKGDSLTFSECFNFCQEEQCFYFTFSTNEPGHCELWLNPKDESDLVTGENTLANLFSTYDCGFAASGTNSPTTLAPTISTPAPSAATVAPTLSTAAPTKSTSAPTLSTSAPTLSTSAPTGSTPSPTQATSAPSASTSAPSASTSAPTGSTLAPTVSTMSPTTGAPTGTSSPTTEAEALGKGSSTAGMPDEVMYAMAGAGVFLFILGIVIGLFVRRRGKRSKKRKEQADVPGTFPNQSTGNGSLGVSPSPFGSGSFSSSSYESGRSNQILQPPPGLLGPSSFGSQRRSPPPLPAREVNQLPRAQAPPLPPREMKKVPPQLPARGKTTTKPPLPPRSHAAGNVFLGHVKPSTAPPPLVPRAGAYTDSDSDDEWYGGPREPGYYNLPNF